MLSYYNQDTPEFRLSINISAAPSLVFSAWAVQGDMESWGMKKARFYSPKGKELGPGESISKGSTFCWMWHTWPDYVLEGRVMEIRQNTFLKFDIGQSGKVSITCKSIDSLRTNLLLTHTNLKILNTSSSSIDCWLHSWSFWLINLKSFLEHGVSLYETDIPLMGKDRLEVVNQ